MGRGPKHPGPDRIMQAAIGALQDVKYFWWKEPCSPLLVGHSLATVCDSGGGRYSRKVHQHQEEQPRIYLCRREPHSQFIAG